MERLKDLLKKEPKYRLQQAKKALFRDLIKNWREATVFPLQLRGELEEKFPINISGKTSVSKDKNTQKALISLKDGLQIETVLMRHKGGRNTVCVSSQVGCPLNCAFCLTGKQGFKRNLDSWEIVQQVLFFARDVKITNVVFMGMGEPFLNYDNVMEAIRILNDKEGFNLGARRISISTIGIVEGIRKLPEEKLQVNLAISLHAPENELRSKLVPVNEKYPIEKVLEAVDFYIGKTGRRVMFEYIMIKGVNDSERQAESLAKIMEKPLYFVNLISCNPTGQFKPSSTERIRKFKETLESEGISVTERYRFGRDIDGACGQLSGEYGF